MATINGIFCLLLLLLGMLLFSQKGLWKGFEIWHWLLSNKNIRIPTIKKIWPPPLTPCTMRYLGGQGGVIGKSCPRILKLCICLLRGWGRCLKLILQTRAPKKFRSCWWGWGECRACADTGARIPIGVSRNLINCFQNIYFVSPPPILEYYFRTPPHWLVSIFKVFCIAKF